MSSLRAIESYLHVSPTTGNGNETINISADSYKGRIARSTVLTVTGQRTSGQATVTVRQLAATEYVSFSSTTASPGKEGGPLTITGTSNSKILTFSFGPDGANPIEVTLPSSYSAGGINTANGAAIEGDPGSTGEYTFSITLQIPENLSLVSPTKTLIVTAEGGQSSTCSITQTASEPFIYINEEGATSTEITLTAEGTPVQTFSIISNDEWTIS